MLKFVSKISLFFVVVLLFSSFNPEQVAKVKISTDFGDMTVKLYNETPAHRDNFLKLASSGAYDGTLFHRVIAGFMMQGGDLASKGATATTPLGYGCNDVTLPAEINPKFYHKKGALAAARTPDSANPEKRSSTCQFYVVQGYRYTDAQLDGMETPPKEGISDKEKAAHNIASEQKRTYYKVNGGTPFLDNQYTVFGEVIDGLEVIDLVCGMRTNASNRPFADVAMKVTVLEK